MQDSSVTVAPVQGVGNQSAVPAQCQQPVVRLLVDRDRLVELRLNLSAVRDVQPALPQTPELLVGILLLVINTVKPFKCRVCAQQSKGTDILPHYYRCKSTSY